MLQFIGIKAETNKYSILINDIKNLPVIIDVLVEVYGGRLKVGDDIMTGVVGGDTRKNVFPALIKAVDCIKTESTAKKEVF